MQETLEKCRSVAHVERESAGKKLIGDDAECEEIGRDRRRAAQKDLGRHVSNRAGGPRLVALSEGDTEVENLHLPVDKKDVGRLQITVDDVASVHVDETAQELNERFDFLFDG